MNKHDERRTPPNILTTLLEILQNAAFAGATTVEITTTADDYGGTVVVVTDDGHGAADLAPFTEPEVSSWPTQPTAENPRGHALMDCLGEQRFEIASRCSPLDPGRTKRFQPKIADELEWTEDPATLIPTKTGTAIRFRSRWNRWETREEAHQAAVYMPIHAVVIDGEPARHRSLTEGASPDGSGHEDPSRTEWNGITINVEKQRGTPIHDGCLHGIPLKLGLKSVPADRWSRWTARMDLSGWTEGRLQRDRRRPDQLVDDEMVETLQTEAYRAILQTIARNEPTSALPTEVFEDARRLGIELATTSATLAPWDVEDGPLSSRRAASENDVLIDLDPDDEGRDDRLTRENLRRALELNTDVQGLKPEAKYRGQPWYNRIPTARSMKLTLHTADDGHIDMESKDAEAMRVGGDRTAIDAVLLDADGKTIKVLMTDLALVGTENDLHDTRIHVAKDHNLTVERLTDALEGAFCEYEGHSHRNRERAEFRAEAEYKAARLIEEPTEADLRQIIRMTKLRLTPHMARQPYPDQDIRITVSIGGITAEIVNTTTQETVSKSATYAELRGGRRR